MRSQNKRRSAPAGPAVSTIENLEGVGSATRVSSHSGPVRRVARGPATIGRRPRRRAHLDSPPCPSSSHRPLPALHFWPPPCCRSVSAPTTRPPARSGAEPRARHRHRCRPPPDFAADADPHHDRRHQRRRHRSAHQCDRCRGRVEVFPKLARAQALHRRLRPRRASASAPRAPATAPARSCTSTAS